MDDPNPYPDTDHDTDGGPDHGSISSTPRWVSVLGIAIVIALVVLIVALHATGIIGPGLHSS